MGTNNPIIDAIRQLEVKRYGLLNEFFYLSQAGYVAAEVGDTEDVQEISIQVKVVRKDIEKVDKALEALSELESFDYKAEIYLAEVE